jgi:hypothetical protein
MFDKTQQRSSGKTIVFLVALIMFLLLWMSVTTFGQTTGNTQNAMAQTVTEKKPEAVVKPVLQNYRDITIGMTDKEAREKLGKPEIADEQSIYYKFNEEESVQLMLDQDKKVRIVSMMYFDKNSKAPKPADIFGADVQVTPNTDGSIYKMIRYPDAGYVVVYSRTAGDSPMVVITMQKI